MRDSISNIKTEVALVTAVKSASGDGVAIDTKDANRLAFVVTTGAIVSSGDFSVKLQDSDTTTSGDFQDVDAAQVDTNAPATLEATSAYRLGYRGFKRYARLVLTKNGGTSIAAGAVAVLSDLSERPA